MLPVHRTFSYAKTSLRSLRLPKKNGRVASVFSSSVLSSSTRALSTKPVDLFTPIDQFERRHIGPSTDETKEMLNVIGCANLDELVQKSVPAHIQLEKELDLEHSLSESEALTRIRKIAEKNKVMKNFIGMGYYETTTPYVILRNMLENPGWYTAYTPYQAEISQGRLESLLNFQTMIVDITGMDISNASLLDEATAAAEAMTMCHALKNYKRNKFFVSNDAHPQTIGLLETRAKPLGIELVMGNPETFDFGDSKDYMGAYIQYPNTYGALGKPEEFVAKAHAAGSIVVAGVDLMALTHLKSPGEIGIDVCVGSAQRFGVPIGFGGPHAGFMATSKSYSRKMAGRIIGVSIDSQGAPALRMAMQTREQHIRRDKATSNICTAQALLANMAASYGVYHGPQGLKKIAARIHALTCLTAEALKDQGFKLSRNTDSEGFFDTITVDVGSQGMTSADVQNAALEKGINVRIVSETEVGLSFGETITKDDVVDLLSCFKGTTLASTTPKSFTSSLTEDQLRQTPFMTHPVFNTHHSETQMLRYLKRLENKDLSLNTSMISLGSCTMKLNSTSEMIPITWPEFANIHPFAPTDQTEGYLELIDDLNRDLATLTGFAAVSAQPNSGAQGEFSGLLCIRNYHESRGEGHRNVCLIPVSAHGTNPASAIMAGYKVVVVGSDENGNIDIDDFKSKADKHADNLAALMITYPSTYGVFEEGVKDIINYVHSKGGQVYMDGANMNAQVGLTSPGEIGADVCHLNLHKTFCIPHGGGGPGVGSIGVAKHLAPHLPGHNVVPVGGEGENVIPKAQGNIAAAPYGSAAILPISYMYIKMMGKEGLKTATEMAILNANYMAAILGKSYKVLYTGRQGYCAHEFIIDLRPFKKVGITEEDIAKRLQDYGFHSPTMSWPVSGTIMVEPTESEDKGELDRFIHAMLAIREEIEDVAQGKYSSVDESPLKGAPHTLDMITKGEWNRLYSKETAVFPAPWVKANKFWPTVGRVDNVYGDRNLVCSCPPLSDYEEEVVATGN